MKTIVQIGAIMITTALVIIGAVYGARLLSNAVTPITISKPVDGITCALAVTSEGAAISCWKD